jgi:hypothetical protein
MTNPTPFYQPNTPLITTTFADWQINFLNNFKRLSDSFAVNHIPLESTSNPGNHTYVDLLTRGTNPQTSKSDFSIFSAQDPNTNDLPEKITQLFMSFQNNQIFQFTNHQIYPITPQQPNQTQYFTFLPGSLIVYFGKISCAGLINVNILLNPAIAKVKGILSVNLTAVDNTGYQPFILFQLKQDVTEHQVVNISSNGLKNSGSNPLRDYYYLIIGNV